MEILVFLLTGHANYMANGSKLKTDQRGGEGWIMTGFNSLGLILRRIIVEDCRLTRARVGS